MSWLPPGSLPDGWLPIGWLPDGASTPILVGDPRYIVARQRARNFTVRTAMARRRFESKRPGEKIPLVFDLSPDLPEGVLLTSVESVAITTTFGTDASPSSIQNGTAALDLSTTKAIVPVQAGVDGCDYKIVVRCPTTDPLLVIELDGTLPVRA